MAGLSPEGDGSRKEGSGFAFQKGPSGGRPEGAEQAGEKRVSHLWLMLGPIQTRGLAPCSGVSKRAVPRPLARFNSPHPPEL